MFFLVPNSPDFDFEIEVSSYPAPLNATYSTKVREGVDPASAFGYTSKQLDAVPDVAHMGLGCGNPIAAAFYKRGRNLGSGGGIDVFLAAQKSDQSGTSPVSTYTLYVYTVPPLPFYLAQNAHRPSRLNRVRPKKGVQVVLDDIITKRPLLKHIKGNLVGYVIGCLAGDVTGHGDEVLLPDARFIHFEEKRKTFAGARTDRFANRR